jgi:uncharacterized membrane protein YfcA
VDILLPVAGTSLNIFLLIGTGMIVGFLSGLVGVGGGFLMTPILIMIGVPPTVAAASDSNAIVATSASGAAVHFRLGNVDLKLGSVLLLGNADFVITITYVVVLGSVGAFMFLEGLHSLRRGVLAPVAHRRSEQRGFLHKLPFQMQFPGSKVQHSVLVPFALCALVGVLSAIMGVGGGFIMVPMMVYLLRMPMHTAIGTDLFQILFTSAGVTIMQATTNHTVDVVLALLIALGSTAGAQIGARLARLLRGDQLKIVLASVVLLVTAKMAWRLVVTPESLLSYASGH